MNKVYMYRKSLLKKTMFAAVLMGMSVGLTACGMSQSNTDVTVKPEETEKSSEMVSSETETGDSEDAKFYEKDGYLAERNDLLNTKMLEKSAKHFTTIYESYLEPNGIKPYFVIIPDKNYYLGDTEALAEDFEQMVSKMNEQCPFMQYIDIRDKLSIEDYYKTDSHWRQECIVDVAEYLGAQMGNPFHQDYETEQIDHLFEGSYYKEIQTDVSPDEVNYLTNDMLRNCIVSKYEGMEPEAASLYNMDKAAGDNPYDMFLEGAVPIITVENPNADTDKKLIVFRDSFGSSIAPLLAGGYRSITLVDIRYIQSGLVGKFVDFTGSDVLFLYSSILLNNSAGMK